MATERAVWHICGQERDDLIDDLAKGDLTQAQIGEKYQRHENTIKQFAARNHHQVEARRRELRGELAYEAAHLWTSDKLKMQEYLTTMLEDFRARLEDENLPDGVRVRFSGKAHEIARTVLEMHGFLQQRSQVDLNTTAPLFAPDKFVETPDGTFHPVAATNGH